MVTRQTDERMYVTLRDGRGRLLDRSALAAKDWQPWLTTWKAALDRDAAADIAGSDGTPLGRLTGEGLVLEGVAAAARVGRAVGPALTTLMGGTRGREG